MKKLIALFTAMAFALTLGVAFAEEQSASPTARAKKGGEEGKFERSLIIYHPDIPISMTIAVTF